MHDNFDDDFIKRRERVGAAIVFWLTFTPCCLAITPALVSPLLNSMGTVKLLDAVTGLLCIGFSIGILTMAGSLLGKVAAKCPSVKSAFLWGAFLSGPLILFLLLLLLLPFYIFSQVGQFPRKELIPLFFMLTIISSCGSLISGFAAIYVRDYRQTQRKRWIPQFTLQEIFIVFTIVAVIISSMTTIALV